MTIVEQLRQSRLVDQSAARAIDDPNARFRFRKVFRAQNIARLISQRRVQSDEISPFEQAIKCDFLNAHFNRAILCQKGIKCDHFHL